MQTILGAGGDIARLLAQKLKQYTERITLISHNLEKENEDDELLPLYLLKNSILSPA